MRYNIITLTRHSFHSCFPDRELTYQQQIQITHQLIQCIQQDKRSPKLSFLIFVNATNLGHCLF